MSKPLGWSRVVTLRKFRTNSVGAELDVETIRLEPSGECAQV